MADAGLGVAYLRPANVVGGLGVEGAGSAAEKCLCTSPTNICPRRSSVRRNTGSLPYHSSNVTHSKRTPLPSGPRVQLQRDVALGAVHHLLGHACLAATLAVAGPTFRQKQIAVDQAMEIVARVAQMHGDDAVLVLAHRAAVLPLHARRLLPFLE